jgi:uncharacterized RDD family membrane protein YckC
VQIYVRRHGQRVGPFTLEEINRHLAAGGLEPADEAWSEGSPGWKPLLSLQGVILPGGASSTAMPTTIATPTDVVLPRYAGFWIRAAAFIMDVMFLGTAAAVVGFLVDRVGPQAPGTTNLSSAGSILRAVLAVCLLYMPVMWVSGLQATFGQRIFGLRVVSADGERITLGQAVLRVFAMVLAAAIAGIGYIMVGFTAAKRGLHDMIANTRVVRVD